MESAFINHPKEAPKGLVLRRLLRHLTFCVVFLLEVALDLFHSKSVNLFNRRCKLSNSESSLMRQRELLFKCEEKKLLWGRREEINISATLLENHVFAR